MTERRKSLRSRITLAFGSFVAASMILLGGTVGYRLFASLEVTLEEQLRERATADAEKLAQRLDYLVESAEALAKNALLVNGISDAQARQTSVPPLVASFMAGRDVRAVALLDFDGRPVYSSLPALPSYHGSRALRAALNEGVVGQEVDLDRKQWRLFVPIVFYSTTQGALLVDLDLPAVAARVLTLTSDVQHTLSSRGTVLYVSSERAPEHGVRERRRVGAERDGPASPIDLELEVAMSRDRLIAPADAAIRDVALLGLVLTLLAIVLARSLGHRLVAPILVLRERVARADGTPERRCAPLGTDDELEELAAEVDQRALALKVDEERLQLATRAANIGVWDWDIAKDQLVWDESMYRLYGLRREDFGGAYEAWISHVHPDDAARTNAAIQAALRGEAEYAPEFRVVRPDGSVCFIQAASRTFHDAGGKPVRMIGVNIDVTARKQSEAELAAHRDHLEAMVEERTAALEQANKELEAFSYSVSHDLRAPLRAIDGFSRMLQEDYGPKVDDEGRRLLGVVRKSTVHMGRLIDDILRFSRTGRQEMAKVPVDMAALAREVFEEVRSAAPGRDIELVLGAMPPAQGDRALIRQVLVNLLANAVKYSAARPKAVIEVDGETAGEETTYRVKDNGAGFDMRYVDRLFGVFQRLHTTSEFEGTGIGLAIVKRIIVRHGGRVWAEGAVDQGATFHFSLPSGRARVREPGERAA